MDDILHQKYRKPPATRYSAEISYTNSRVRGRAQLRDPSCLQTSSSASSCGGASTASSGSSASGRVTSRLMNNVRKSLSYSAGAKKRDSGLADIGMQSTPEESLSPTHLHVRAGPYGYDYADYDHDHRNARATSPTIEQIAMGLHISRTPHLGPARGFSHSQSRSRYRDTPDAPRSVSPPPMRTRPSHHRRDSAPITVSPPSSPLKSSLKSTAVLSVPPTPSDSNVSLSTITTSTTPSTPQSTKSGHSSMSHFSTRLHLRMSKLLLPGKKNTSSSIAGTTSSDDDSATSELTPRKVVRFSAIAEAGDDR